MKHLTVTIGIPAKNEEGNIARLLTALLDQKMKYGDIIDIMVYSDGSTDDTVAVARALKDPRIRVIDQKVNCGINAVQNHIVKEARGDILILLDADVLPKNNHFCDDLIAPFLKNPAVGLVGARTESLPGRTLIERILSASHVFKQKIYEKINHGDTVYLCHGRARAFLRKLYTRIHWPENCPEDAYSFFACLESGMKFSYTPSAAVLFRSPATVTDHMLQSKRFSTGIDTLKHLFPTPMIERAYAVPKKILLQETLSALISHPFAMIGYIGITLYMKCLKTTSQIHLTKWQQAQSTKKL